MALGSGTYTVQQSCNNRFLDVDEGPGFQVVTRVGNKDRQIWVFTHIGGNEYTIQEKISMRFLDAYEDKGNDFKVVTRHAQGDDSQKWVFKHIGGHEYRIQQKVNMRFLDAYEDKGHDFRVVTRDAQRNNSQKWILVPAAAPAADEHDIQHNHSAAKRPRKETGFSQRGVVGGLPGAPEGIPIMCFPCVSNEAADRTNWVVYSMLKDGDQNVVRRMCGCKCSVGIIGTHQVGSDLPPHAFLKQLKTFDGRSYDEGTRGVGGVKGCPLTSVGEENMTMAPGDRYSKESILVHEFGHAVMNLGFDNTQIQRIDNAYQAALRAGRNRSLYMFSSKEEFWANGTQAWFNAICRTDVNEGITTREKLQRMHPDLAQLMGEVYGNGHWRYTQDCAKPSLWASS